MLASDLYGRILIACTFSRDDSSIVLQIAAGRRQQVAGRSSGRSAEEPRGLPSATEDVLERNGDDEEEDLHEAESLDAS